MDTIELDENDSMLLRLLEEDASQSIKALAKRTGIRPSTVFHRIKRMKQAGVILGETIRVDKKKSGVPLGLYIFLKVDNSKLTYGRKGGLSKRLMQIPFVESVSETTGNLDIVVKAYVPSIEKMNELVVDKIRELEGIISTETYVILRDHTKR